MRDIVSSLTAMILIQASNIVSGVLLARYLLPDGRGELAAVMLWPTVIAIVGAFGLHEAIAFHGARHHYGARQILRNAMLLAGGLCAVLLPIGVVVAHVVFADDSAEVRNAAYLYLTFIPLNFIGLFLVSSFQGGLRFVQWNLLRTSVSVLYLLLIVALHLSDTGSVRNFAAASLLANVGMICLAIVLYRGVDWPVPDTAATRPAWRELMRYGASVHFGTAVAFIAERLDQMIISIFLPAADLGLFVIAATLSRLPLLLATTLATVSFPKIVSMEDDAGRAEIFGRYARVATLMIAPCALVLAAAMSWLVPLFFGASFAAAVPIAWLLTVSALPLSLKAMMSTGFKACDRSLVIGQAEIVGLVVSAGGLAVLVPSYGLIGAAVVSILAQGGSFVFMMIRARQTLGIAPGDLLIPRLADVALIVETGKELRARLMDRAGIAG